MTPNDSDDDEFVPITTTQAISILDNLIDTSPKRPRDEDEELSPAKRLKSTDDYEDVEIGQVVDDNAPLSSDGVDDDGTDSDEEMDEVMDSPAEVSSEEVTRKRKRQKGVTSRKKSRVQSFFDDEADDVDGDDDEEEWEENDEDRAFIDDDGDDDEEDAPVNPYMDW
jgi:hypothetical protein